MESTSAYVIAITTALVLVLVSAFIANAIHFEGGANPKDPGKRRNWFWALAIINPLASFAIGYFIFIPDANHVIVNRYVSALSIGTAVGFVVYILVGFVLSRMFRNGKIGHWF